jgi:hypothetical protein
VHVYARERAAAEEPATERDAAVTRALGGAARRWAGHVEIEIGANRGLPVGGRRKPRTRSE